MADNTSRFTSQSSQGQTTQERLSTNTVGLVALSDYRKRRAEIIEQQEREARELALRGTAKGSSATPDPAGSDSSSAQQPAKKKSKTKKKPGKSLLSFDDEDGEGEEEEEKKENSAVVKRKAKKTQEGDDEGGDGAEERKKSKFAANTSVTVVPKALTKAALRKEAAERETLRQEFLLNREAVKAVEIAIPFVFYDGSNIPGGIVRVKKGDFVWVFLDKSRKVGAERGVGEKSNARRAWARVGVDDLMMVRGTIIIPHVSFYPTLSAILSMVCLTSTRPALRLLLLPHQQEPRPRRPAHLQLHLRAPDGAADAPRDDRFRAARDRRGQSRRRAGATGRGDPRRRQGRPELYKGGGPEVVYAEQAHLPGQHVARVRG